MEGAETSERMRQRGMEEARPIARIRKEGVEKWNISVLVKTRSFSIQRQPEGRRPLYPRET